MLYNASERTVIRVANTTAVYARIDTELKESAESIFAQLGVTPSSAIQMFYRQVGLPQGIPFELKLPGPKRLDMSRMTREELDAELEKGLASMKGGLAYTADEVDAILARKYGI